MKLKNIYKIILFASIIIAVSCHRVPQKTATNQKPNLLIIQTDEHTFKTLGCYRDLMPKEQAYVWGEGIEVKTPNIDRIAHEGAICTNFYASSPVCTPSRASFQTGLYPISAGAPINDMAMNPNLTTFAEVLRQEGYQTSYIGKWHLGGTPDIGHPYMEPGYAFGYLDRTYMFEGQHAKWIETIKEPNGIIAVNKMPKPEDKAVYTTDYLANKCLQLLERDKSKPFCMMVSIPDPHSPDIAREPYISMYKDLKVKMPKTMDPSLLANRPKWAVGGKNESGDFDPESVKAYFGMVKCIDDNVGRILKFLDDNKLTENTIVVFTSDHGDLLFEHHRINKDLPYETSARIPFLIRYPNKIKAAKIIKKTYTTADFAPTILGIMNAGKIAGVEGINDASSFLNNESEIESDRIIYMTDSPFNEWTAATDGRYKLVLSCKEFPWLFDLQKDPSELINYYSDPAYQEIAQKFQKELLRQMTLYKEPALDLGYHYLLSTQDKVTYISPYAGKSIEEIPKMEKEVLNQLRLNIHKKCYRPLK
ncbi:sulfatase-like hydrolase/transferase [Pedobacter sp.]|uniref:sulfatase-like hydrolase/transferase n=1 Tax=Pedobacter sp. TaxID=1411316 RepID=UPI003C446051